MSDPCLPLLIQILNEGEQPTLWIADENLPREVLAGLRPRAGLQAITNRFDTWQALRERNIACELKDFEFNFQSGEFQQVLYRVSKERALVHHCINRAAELLPQSGELILLGRKNDGIKTHTHNAEQRFGSQARSKKHGLCYVAHISREEPGAELPCDNYPELRLIKVGDFEFYSKPGIYGWNKIDRGSELLVAAFKQQAAPAKDRRLLDLGCGWGYLLLATAALPFAERVATDNNVGALIAARKNFQAAGLEVTTSADDCGSQLQGKFDTILCNPPFHQGFSVSEALSLRFLSQAAKLLAEGGEAFFVVNRGVPLERLAASYFGKTTLLLEQDGFRVFRLSH